MSRLRPAIGHARRSSLRAGTWSLFLVASVVAMSACGQQTPPPPSAGSGSPAAAGSGTTLAGSQGSAGAKSALPEAPTALSAAPTTSAPASSGPTGKVVIALAPQTTASVDPALTSGASDYANTELLYNRLLEPLPDRSDLGPGLATKYTVSPDGKTIEFEIRQGVKFHNGDPLTPEDVVFTFERVLKIGQPISKAPLERFLDRMEIKGNSVVFHLKAADWKFVPEISKTYYSIVPKKYLEQVGDEGFLKAPVGTGSFKFVSWSKQEFLEVEAIDGHFLHTPGVKRLRYQIVPEETTRLAMVRTGEADLAQISVTSLRAIGGDAQVRPIRVPDSGGLRLFLFGQANPQIPFSKLEVRQALSHAINREAIAQKVYQGYAKPTGVATYNPAQPGYPSWGSNAPAYDVEKAKDLLAKAGYPGGQGLKLTFHNFEYPTLPLWTQVAPVIASDWEKIGIQVDLRQWEWGSYAPVARTGKFDPLSVSTHIGNLGSAWDVAGSIPDFTSSGTYKVPAGIEDGAYPDLKKLAEDYDHELDPEKRAALREQVLAYDRDNVVFIPIVTQDGLWAAGPRVLEYSPMPGTIYTGNMFTIKVKA